MVYGVEQQCCHCGTKYRSCIINDKVGCGCQPMLSMAVEMERLFSEVKASQENDAERQARWDQDFLALAKFWALRKSKDPSTKVGAVIVRPNMSVAGLGYNGFAQGVNDGPERYADREVKLSMVVHGEINAILFTEERLEGYTLYTWPFQPCAACAGKVIQKGIKRVVSPPLPAELVERWGANVKWAQTQFEEAGVQLDIVELKEHQP